jgi:NADH-quinone oxidoreductase subunit A
VDDFVPVAGLHLPLGPLRTRQDFEISLDGHALAADPQVPQERLNRQPCGYFPGFPVDHHCEACRHRLLILELPDGRQKKLCAAHLTERRPGRYYSVAKMSGSYLQSYVPLLLHLLVAMALAGAILLISTLIGQHRPTRAKLQAYECGVPPQGDAREPFSVKFYLVAMVFILFDVEAIFLYPWAYVYRELHWFGFVEMLLYILILLVGYIYLWKKGALDWNR